MLCRKRKSKTNVVFQISVFLCKWSWLTERRLMSQYFLTKQDKNLSPMCVKYNYFTRFEDEIGDLLHIIRTILYIVRKLVSIFGRDLYLFKKWFPPAPRFETIFPPIFLKHNIRPFFFIFFPFIPPFLFSHFSPFFQLFFTSFSFFRIF